MLDTEMTSVSEKKWEADMKTIVAILIQRGN